ncbi:MAG: MFS transporter [Rhodothalassiaceae bacterium]
MTDTAATAAPPKITAHGKFVILAATALALLATPLASPAMPEIARVFAERAATEPFARGILALIDLLPGTPNVNFLVKFIMLSIPALFIILSAPLTGWMSDRWGRKPLLNLSLAVFAISGVSGYFADSFFLFFLGRAVLGLAISGIKTATVAMVGDFFTGPERNRFIGWQGSAMKIGGVVFMLLGGALANYGWEVPFLGYLLAFLLLPSALFALGESLPARAPVVRRAAAGLPPDVPLLPVAYVFVSAFLASAFFFITPVQLPFYLTTEFNATPFETGAAIALGNTIGALSSLYYHRVKGRISYPAVYSLIFLSMSAGYYALTLATDYATSLIAMVIAGVGFGLYVPNHSAWILAVVSAKRRGVGVGIVTTAMFLGQFAAPVVAVPVIDHDNPAHIWRAVSGTLFVLAILYAALARLYPPAPAKAAPAS